MTHMNLNDGYIYLEETVVCPEGCISEARCKEKILANIIGFSLGVAIASYFLYKK